MSGRRSISTRDELHDLVRRLAPSTEGLGLEQVVVRVRIPRPVTSELRDMIVRISNPGGPGMVISFRPYAKLQPLKPLAEYDQKVVRMRQRGFIYPYEIIKMLTPALEHTRAEFPAGDFIEHDLDSQGRLVAVDRPYGQNKANIIVGVIRNFTAQYPEGMTRVFLLGDPSKDLGAVAEPECRRILAALELAQTMTVPVEWFTLCAGAKISMDSGVENMDWVARVLRGLIEFTQAGGEVNLVVNGINVGAQPYWNAEATMLMHTRGILIMTPQAAMVLTGKRALEFSGSISAEDNQGIGGYDRIMGINGQAQYWARDIDEACHILLRYYDHTYVAPGERFPRRAATADPIDRDVRRLPSWPERQWQWQWQLQLQWQWRSCIRNRRRDLIRRDQPWAQKVLRHPQGNDGSHRPGSCSARTLGRNARGRDCSRMGRPSRRLSRLSDWHRIPAIAAVRVCPS